MRRVLGPVVVAVISAACAGGVTSGGSTTGSSPTGGPPGSPVPADAPATSTDVAVPSVGSADEVRPIGFDRVAATVTTPDGEVCELCLWLATTADQRARGLMEVTDLGPTDGMAFVYPDPRTGNFWMKNTLLPLSIAFYGRGGGFLDAFDMEPCESDPCPLYRTPTDFVIAVETVQGGLADLGMVPGSTIDLTDLPCP